MINITHITPPQINPHVPSLSHPQIRLDQSKRFTHLHLVPISELCQRYPQATAFDLLDQEERHAFAQIKAKGRHREFLYGRFLVKHLIACYSHAHIEQVQLRKTALGKLILDRPSCPLYFNLSHSQDLIAFAISDTAALGIDIESLDRTPPSAMSDIARRHFCHQEAELVCAAPESERHYTFYRMWTCKEAALKAIGVGLTIPMSSIDTLQLNDSDCIKASVDNKTWSLYTRHWHNPKEGYHLAISKVGPPGPVELFEGEEVFRYLPQTHP